VIAPDAMTAYGFVQADANFHFAFKTSMELENRLLEHFDQVAARQLDATKFAFTALIQLFDARCGSIRPRSVRFPRGLRCLK
jgi:hypothetical protein